MLNKQQLAAVQYIDGPCLVLAGAGSGKTRVITKKIAYLITECGLKAANITAVTFTNKAAKEMQARVAQELDRKARRGLTVSTFHNLGLTILRQELEAVGLKAGFSIFDAQDSLSLIRNLLNKSNNVDKDFLFQVQQQISNWKNDMLSPEQASLRQWESPFQVEAAKIFSQYNHHLQAYNAVDFDDLILKPTELFLNNEEVLGRWQNKIRYLLVDEYQDSNNSQYLLVKLLTGIRGQFTVVGDDDQSIYAWRGARPENLNLLQKDFPTLKLIKLEQNYRSTARILHAANVLIANNPHLFDKKLWSELGAGELLRVVATKDEVDEAEQVVADLISHKLRFNTDFKDYAILYRGNHQSRVFEKVLRDNSVPYKLSGGQSFFSRSEIKDVFAYIRLLCNPDDDTAFLRIINTPKRGIGDATLEKLGRYATKRQKSLYLACNDLALTAVLSESARIKLVDFFDWMEKLKSDLDAKPVLDVIKQMIDETGYEAFIYENADTPVIAEKRMANVWDLVAWIERLIEKNADHNLSDVVSKLILLDILDRQDEQESDQVQLMTLHASKGLEFPHVYLVGMEEELLPHRTSIEEENIEEERRLAYVGITRAQKTLCMTIAKQRKRYGEIDDCLPSRFLDELPDDLLEWSGYRGQPDEAKSKETAKSHLAGMMGLLS